MRPGGILAFQEYDLSTWVPGWPEHPLNARLMSLFVELLPRITHANAGSRLHHWYREIGFPSPLLLGNVLADGAEDSVYYEWAAESLRPVLPLAEQMGLAKPGEFDLDRLAQDLREYAVAHKTTACGLIMIGAHARKPE